MKAEGRNSYLKHFLTLSAFFVLGNAVITAPQRQADEFNFLGFLLSGIITLAVCFISYLLPFNKITAAAVSVLAFAIIGDTAITFIKFIHTDLLPETKPFLIVLPIIVILIFIGFKNKETLLKFSLVCFLPCFAVIIFFFISTAKDFNFKNIFIYEFPQISHLWRQTLPYIKSVTLPTVLLMLFLKTNDVKRGVAIGGFGLGFLLLGITILNSVLLFGIEFSGVLDYPYATAGSTVTFGNLFTRLDGFLYFVYLTPCIVKCGVGIYVIKKSRSILAP